MAKVVEVARSGDATALRIRIDRLVPPVKARDEPVTLPRLSGSLGDRGRAVLDAIATEQLTPDQAGAILSAIATQARIVELNEIEQRVAALEAKTEWEDLTGAS